MSKYTELENLLHEKSKNIKTQKTKVILILDDKNFSGVYIATQYLKQGRSDIVFKALDLIMAHHKIVYSNQKIDIRFEECE